MPGRLDSCVSTPPTNMVSPRTTKDTFINACRGEHTYRCMSLLDSPQPVFPRSLMKFSRRLNGVVQASATQACAMKNWADDSQQSAPTVRLFISSPLWSLSHPQYTPRPLRRTAAKLRHQ